MTVALYPLTLEKLWKGLIDANGGTVKVRAVDSTYTYSDTHEFLSDTTGALGTDATVSGKAFTAGVFTADNPVITGTSSGDVVTGLIYYIDTGVAGTSPLIGFDGESPGGAPMNYLSDGTNITVALQSGNQVASI